MRHRAVPGDPKDKPDVVMVDQRLHVKVTGAMDAKGKERVFWFRKVSRLHSMITVAQLTAIQTVGTGKVLDLLAQHLGKSTPVRLCIYPSVGRSF